VRNVSVVLGLRPFTAKAKILPEQVIGRGLRLMTAIGPDRTQTLEVLGTRNLLNVLREQLEAEGVGVTTAKDEPTRPVIIEPVKDRLVYDIAIPITKPRLMHNDRKLATLDPAGFQAIYQQEELAETFRINLKMEFATTETEVHQADLAAGAVPIAQELLRSITNKVLQRAKLPMAFATLYPLVRTYIATRCFGKMVDLDSEAIRAHLRRLELQDSIARYLAREIATLTVEKRAIEFDKADFKLSDTKKFSWRRNLPPLVAERTVFNYVATYNDFERQFAQFLDAAPDVLRFASLGTTEQGESGTLFRIDYLKPSGAIGLYYPDWVAVQMTEHGEVNWIIETKGRLWADTTAKDAAMRDWCARIVQQTGQHWEYARVDQSAFEAQKPQTLADATLRHCGTFAGGESHAQDPTHQ
jgi:type III restriction enzyme